MLLHINRFLYLSSLSLHANLSLLFFYISKDSSTHSPPRVLTDANLFSRFWILWPHFEQTLATFCKRVIILLLNPDSLNQILND